MNKEIIQYSQDDSRYQYYMKKKQIRFDKEGNCLKQCSQCLEFFPYDSEHFHGWHKRDHSGTIVSAHCRSCEHSRKKARRGKEEDQRLKAAKRLTSDQMFKRVMSLMDASRV